jgi:hypothetical protein
MAHGKNDNVVELDIIKFQEIMKDKMDKDPEFNPNIFTGGPFSEECPDDFITKFNFGKINKYELVQFNKDLNRGVGIYLSHNGIEVHLHPEEINISTDNASLELANIINNKLSDARKNPVEDEEVEKIITAKQAERVIQHFHQRSLSGISVLALKKDFSALPVDLRLLKLEFDKEEMKMSYDSTSAFMKFKEDVDPTKEFCGSSKFDSTIDKDGVFKKAIFISQYTNPDISSFHALKNHQDFSKAFQKSSTDISGDNINNNIIPLLDLYKTADNKKFEEVLKTAMPLFQLDVRPKGVEEILSATVFDPTTPKDKRDFVRDNIIDLPNAAELLADSLRNLLVKDLIEQFKDREGQYLTKKDKLEIAEKLGKRLESFKSEIAGQEHLTSFVDNLTDDLNLDKLVKNTARESSDIRIGTWETIKKFFEDFIRHFSRSETINDITLKEFKTVNNHSSKFADRRRSSGRSL